MVFARNKEAASKLSKAWRERDQVSKLYLARVKHWPPYDVEKKLEGIIDMPLAPSEERLEWRVKVGGKPSTTLWKVLKPTNCGDSRSKTNEGDSVVLKLTPVTGRTHQLRVHCASIGSGIEGESLYGDDQTKWNPEQPSSTVLCLHAHKLSFPHPCSCELIEFSSEPSWYRHTYKGST